jgi:hypothetical protein
MRYDNINTFIRRFDNGDFSSNNLNVQFEAGWYDWFCRDTSLRNKTITLAKKVKQIAKSDKIDCENYYVFFKNNCPMVGPLYDDFRICDIENGDVVYTIVPKSGHTGKAEVWGRENGFNGPIVEGTWNDVKIYFGVK